MVRNILETITGAIVIIISILFASISYRAIQVRSMSGYSLTATLSSVGGLGVGSDVRVSGIRVGEVTDRLLDSKTFNAIVTMSVSDDVKLPIDTVAWVASEGPLGVKYLQLQPGSASESISPGGSIKQSKSYRSLEDQVGEIIFYATRKYKEVDNAKTR